MKANDDSVTVYNGRNQPVPRSGELNELSMMYFNTLENTSLINIESLKCNLFIFTREVQYLINFLVPPDSYPVSAVAFYGYMSQSSAHNLSVHHLIVYDLVLINKGNGYNKGDGIFIAPVTGDYAFHFSVCVSPGSESPWATLELTRNGNAIVSTFEESKSAGVGSNYHCSSTLVISDVDVGDHIFIRTNQPTRGAIYSGGAGRISFSGWLLFR